ncbi:hypothetical protein [uncultured Tateyamaria sp.]|uniref:sensor histidine kinase n=1 Tax=uncultured Tateyamaria sp. TaxID=455651 RepID=UPI00261DBF23|nr:hypothetical protein [uncultured Tateyamaria sp.]
MPFDNLKMRGVAHDIKGLMTRAGLAAELLEQHKDEHVQRQADRITRAIQRMNAICRSELQPSVDAALPQLHNCDDTRQLLGNIADFTRDHQKKSGVPIEFKVSVAPLVIFTVDGSALFRVLLDLLTNTARAVAECGGSQVSIDAVAEPGFVVFRLSTDVPQVLQRFMDHLYPCADPASEGEAHVSTTLLTASTVLHQLGGEMKLDTSVSVQNALLIRVPAEPSTMSQTTGSSSQKDKRTPALQSA